MFNIVLVRQQTALSVKVNRYFLLLICHYYLSLLSPTLVLFHVISFFFLLNVMKSDFSRSSAFQLCF